MKTLISILIALGSVGAGAQQEPGFILYDATSNPYPTGSGTPVTSPMPGMTCYTIVAGSTVPCVFGGGGGGTTTNALTFNTTGGAAPGATFNGSAPVTVSPATIGAQPAFTVLPTSAGGTGSSGITGIRKANGASADTAATAGTDYGNPAPGAAGVIPKSNGSGLFVVSSCTDNGTLFACTEGVSAPSVSAGNGVNNGSVTMTYIGTAAATPTAGQFQISPAVSITTPWSLSPAAAPGSGVMVGTNSGGVVQQSFVAASITINGQTCALGSSCGVSNPVSSATGGSGTGTITCASAACTNLRGNYTVAGGTFATGTLLTLVWPTTTTAYVCSGSLFNNATGAAIGYHSIATATGMTFSALTAATGLTVDIDYSCQP